MLDYEILYEDGIIKVKALEDGQFKMAFPTADGKARILLDFQIGSARRTQRGKSTSSPNVKSGTNQSGVFLERLSSENKALAKNVLSNINNESGQDYRNSLQADKEQLEKQVSELLGAGDVSGEEGLVEESLEFLDKRSQQVGLYTGTKEKLKKTAQEVLKDKSTTKASDMDPIEKMLLAKILEQEKISDNGEESVPLTISALEQFNKEIKENKPQTKEDDFEKMLESLMLKSSPKSQQEIAKSEAFSETLCNCSNPCALWDMVLKNKIPGMQEVAFKIAEDSKQKAQARSCAIKYLGNFPDSKVVERLAKLLDQTFSKEVVEAVYESMGKIAWDDKAHERRTQKDLRKSFEKIDRKLLVNINSLEERNRPGPLKTLGKVGVSDALVELARNNSTNNKENRRAIAQSAAALARPASMDILKKFYEEEKDPCMKYEFLQLASWALKNCKECTNNKSNEMFPLSLDGNLYSDIFKTPLVLKDPFLSQELKCPKGKD